MSCLDLFKGVKCAVVSDYGLHVSPDSTCGSFFARRPIQITPKPFLIPVKANIRTRFTAAFTIFD